MRSYFGLLLTGGMLCSAAAPASLAAAGEPTPSIFGPKPQQVSAPEVSPQQVAPESLPSESERTHRPAITATRQVATAEPDKSIKKVDVQPAPGSDLATAYDNYFKSHSVPPKVVREKVRQLLIGAKHMPQRHEEIVALLEGAIRNGQPQPWMFEALALSMEIVHRPAQDVERALMSAADFTTNAAQVMYLGQYLARMGHDARALQLFEQAATLSPTQTEPYEAGLNLALHLNDAHGIRWSSLGILRHAWPRDKSNVQDSARYAAEAAIEKLRTGGKTAEADKFAAELAEATSRDLTVRISWEGDADVDLMVEEPNGTVCSLRSPRTSGGGVMTGDSNSPLNVNASSSSSESYICPQGFSGKYNVAIRQVWGKIPAGKVTVDITTRNAAGRTQQMQRQIPVDEGTALVVFDLPNGRRQQSLEVQQVDTDVKQLAATRAILAQQINALASPSAVAAQQISSQGQSPFVTSFTPVLGRGGAVGFQPQVSLLPSGVTMSATAVISADRRYVRITALPFFSSIGPVTTFNIFQGSTDTVPGLGI